MRALRRFWALIGALADATPPERDRYVDFLRAASIGAVVVGHFFIAVIFWEDGRIYTHNAVGLQRGLWLTTWFLQVMPLFFFVGGFSNLRSWEAARRRGDGYRDWLRIRLVRLLRPAGAFFAVWLAAEAALHLATDASGWLPYTRIPFGPLWFLGVYLVVVASAPAMLRLHQAGGVLVPAVLTAAVLAVDVLRFGVGIGWVGWLNLAFVWFLAHQMGFFYADRSLLRAGRRSAVWFAGIGLAGLIAVTNIGVYPRSMVGTDVEEISNMSPPTVAIVALTFWLVGIAMLLRPRLSLWLTRRTTWRTVIAANSVILTVFLWHLTAQLLVILALHPFGFGNETTTSARWWLERPLWIGAPLAVTVVLVAVFGRFEVSGRGHP